MDISEKTLKRTDIFKGRVFEVSLDDIELCNGEKATREVVWHNGGTACVAVDNNKDIYLVKQWRYPFEKELLEIPAGKLEPGEEPIVCAKRELLEETGLDSKDIEFLIEMYPTPGYGSEKLTLFLTREFDEKSQNLDEGEFLDVVKMPFEKALEMVLNGQIKDAKTQIGIMRANFIINCGHANNM